MRWIFAGAPNSMRLRLKVARLSLENVRHERLRIAVVQREPAALHLHHDAMALLEPIRLRRGVERGMKDMNLQVLLLWVPMLFLVAVQDFFPRPQTLTLQSGDARRRC